MDSFSDVSGLESDRLLSGIDRFLDARETATPDARATGAAARGAPTPPSSTEESALAARGAGGGRSGDDGARVAARQPPASARTVSDSALEAAAASPGLDATTAELDVRLAGIGRVLESAVAQATEWDASDAGNAAAAPAPAPAPAPAGAAGHRRPVRDTHGGSPALPRPATLDEYLDVASPATAAPGRVGTGAAVPAAGAAAGASASAGARERPSGDVGTGASASAGPAAGVRSAPMSARSAAATSVGTWQPPPSTHRSGAAGADDGPPSAATPSPRFSQPPATPQGGASTPGPASRAAPSPAAATWTVSLRTWAALDARLRDAGVPGLGLSVNADAASAQLEERGVVRAFHALLGEVQRLSSTVQDLAVQSPGSGRGAAASDSPPSSRHSPAVLQQRLRKAERAEAAAAQARDAEASRGRDYEARARAAEGKVADLTRQLRHSEHRVKQREGELQALKDRMRADRQHAAEAAARHRKAFEDLTGREPRPSSTTDSKTLAILRLHEDQRAEMALEIEQLREDRRRLHDAVRRAENAMRRDAPSPGRDSPSGGVEQRERLWLERQLATHEDRERELRARERQLDEDRGRWKAELTGALRSLDVLQEQNDTLKLEMQGRPSVGEWRDAQRRMRMLEQELEELVHEAGVSRREVQRRAEAARKERTDARKFTRTKSLVDRDKVAYRLQLNRLNRLGHTALADVVKELCVELGMSDVHALTAAVRKLKRVVAAVPPVEDFVQQVCRVVFSGPDGGDAPPAGGLAEPHVLERVLRVVHTWARERGQLPPLQGVHRRLERELSKREASRRDRGREHADDVQTRFSPEQVVDAVRELVRLENASLHHREAFEAAEAALHDSPDTLINRIVVHFGKLFDVKHLDGMFPKMNEVYLFTNQASNFLTVLKDMLELDPKASVNACMSALQSALRGDGGRVASAPLRGATSRRARSGFDVDAPGRYGGVRDDWDVSGDGDDVAADHVVLTQGRRHGDPPVATRTPHAPVVGELHGGEDMYRAVPAGHVGTLGGPAASPPDHEATVPPPGAIPHVPGMPPEGSRSVSMALSAHAGGGAPDPAGVESGDWITG